MSKTKVLLIRANPSDGLPEVIQFRSVCPPLGVMYLASYLREKRDDVEVEILDPGVHHMSTPLTVDTIRTRKPDILGISALATETFDALALARGTKTTLPELKVVVGGPVTGSVLSTVLECDAVDCAVIGEGEETLLELVDRYAAGEGHAGVPGTAWRRADGVVEHGPSRPLIPDLNEMPFPAWDLIDFRGYSDRVLNMNYGMYARKPYMAVFTSRGCPYRCTYCHDIFSKKARYRTPENVADEFEYLYRTYGVREFHFYDDIFNLDKRRSKRIMDLILERGLDVKMCFPNGLRGDILDEELIVKMARAGVYQINFAIESASPRIQKLTKKHVNIPKISEAIRIAHREGIIPLGFFMLGFPTETPEEIQSTVDLACSLPLLKVFFFNVIPFEGTEMADQARDFMPDYRYDPSITFHDAKPFYMRATDFDINKVVRNAYIRFYGNPRRLWDLFRYHPSKTQYLRNAVKGVMTTATPALWKFLRV